MNQVRPAMFKRQPAIRLNTPLSSVLPQTALLLSATLLLLPSLFFGAAMAQPAKVKPAVTMHQAVNAALARHPMRSLPDSKKSLGAAYRTQADSVFAADPSYNLSYRSDQLNAADGYREFEGSLDFPLWQKGQKSSRRRLAASIEQDARTDQQLLRWQVAGEVLERAWSLRMANMEVAQAKARLQAVKQLQNDIDRRVRAGELARTDLLLAEQNSAEAQTNLLTAIHSQQAAQTSWLAYTGYSALPLDLEKVTTGGSNNQPAAHPLLQAANSRLNSAKAGREEVRTQRRENSTLSLYAKRDRGSDREPFGNSLGIGISVPFGVKAHAMPRLAEANSAVAEAAAEHALQKQQLENEITLAKQAVDAAARAFEQARKQQGLAQQRWKLTRRAFDLGEESLYPLILARQQADQQAYNEQKSRLELGLAKARLQHKLGVTH